MNQIIEIPKGTRDFSPVEMAKRNYIFNTIREVFVLYGYQQIETPAMETIQTLTGKYGEEGDKLFFRVLNSGDFLEQVGDDELLARNVKRLASRICKKGLRYDLTVPLARYVVMNREQLQMPFKRFQIQPVWRADRPRKGRYREFYQCDADIVGSVSLLNEVELMQMADTVFARFGIRVAIKINNRKILAGIADVLGESDKITEITTAIDKLDKIGLEEVVGELANAGIRQDAIGKLQEIISFKGTNVEKIEYISDMLTGWETGLKGIEETRTILEKLNRCGLENQIELDFTLARGLDYYTGAIFEVKALEAEMGSIAGGGRYDNLTGIYGMPDLSGVGISFGADRIFDVLNELDLYPKEVATTTKLLFANFGEKETDYCMAVAQQCRKNDISCEIFPDKVKIKKQMAYANAKGIAFVALVGDNEMAEGKINLKNMVTRQQTLVSLEELIEIVQNNHGG